MANNFRNQREKSKAKPMLLVKACLCSLLFTSECRVLNELKNFVVCEIKLKNYALDLPLAIAQSLLFTLKCHALFYQFLIT